MFAFVFPTIDPILVEIGPFAIRWYALAYITGILLGWRWALRLADSSPAGINRKMLDDFLVWATLGIVFGGRLGYVLFYKFGYFIHNPVEIVYVWQGGMSFHGGMLGVALAIYLFARKHKLPVLAMGDIIACVAPIGLFFGRVANFINGELFGRATDVSWAVLFPRDPTVGRHPSQLYEAGLEGAVLFAVLWFVWAKTPLKQRPGATSGIFLIGYGLSRGFVELFREPDAHLGYILSGITMGQILCIPMILIGAGLLYWSKPLATRGRGSKTKKA
ncbi:MAG: prolipoprotein diacylglyceryl transferase [Alphaproteobacteria bacterium]|jgi:phosphatidylglycerol---prolipoprotein diacylglyceryl transferase|nr:prolipoprotein diacylglyceryl transferase [Rhodospirillaceae bacterium]MBT7615192.1 prolipoprotein diacylglyceryl transferase [Rhodospirillaceae bacterium]MBT7646914.1 prolipoprotein diacylglyceryl transferase [Rhodospirillaceae bacterium]MDG2481667.1 prolipoprotein diacylglyceryl transferase [Alphaproteobacteria bacterium]